MSKLTEAQERFGALHQKMGQLLKEAGPENDFSKVTVFGDDLDTAAKVEKFRELNTEMAVAADECKALELQEAGKRWDRFEADLKTPAAPQPHPGGSGGEKSIGRLIAESAEWDDFTKDRSKDFKVSLDEVELKTLFETTAGWAPEATRTGRVVEAVTRPIQVLDLIPTGPVTQPAVVYLEETLATHSAAEKGEGVTYAESAFELTERSSQVRKITNSIPVTDEQLDDVAQAESYLDRKLRFGARQRLDSQVLNGNGTPPNLRGILNVAGIQTQAKGTDPRFDAIHKAMTKVRVTGRAMPNAIVVNPFDWETIRLTRTADGLYIMGNPSVAGPMTLFGLPIALGDVIAAGTALVGDFQNYCALYERRGIVVEIGYSGTDFVDGKKHMRASFRVAFVVERPAAFCTVTGL